MLSIFTWVIFFSLLSLSFEWNCHWNFKILWELKELYHLQEETYLSTVKKLFHRQLIFNCKISFEKSFEKLGDWVTLIFWNMESLTGQWFNWWWFFWGKYGWNNSPLDQFWETHFGLSLKLDHLYIWSWFEERRRDKAMPPGSLDWTMVRWNHTVAAINIHILKFILA